MKIFISYASERRDIAEALAVELRAHGNQVFLDKDDLPPGLAYDEQIRLAILKSDLMIFLISPESVEAGRYTLTELSVARQKWSSPQGKVLPVIVKSTDHATIPAYLKSVTFLEPAGDLVSDIVHAITMMHTQWARVRLLKITAFFLLSLTIVLAISYFAGKTNKSSVKIVKEDYLPSAKFTVLGNSPYAYWGSSHTLSLQHNSGEADDYECLIYKSENSNIEKITYDKKCENIIIVMKKAPFVDEKGVTINKANLSGNYEYFKISVKENQRVIWSGKAEISLAVIMLPYDYTFNGIQNQGAWSLKITMGKKYSTTLMHKNILIGEGFKCALEKPPQDPSHYMGPGGPIVDIQFKEGSCSADINSFWYRRNADGIGYTVFRSPSSESIYNGGGTAKFAIILTYPETGFKKRLQMNALVDAEIKQ